MSQTRDMVTLYHLEKYTLLIHGVYPMRTYFKQLVANVVAFFIHVISYAWLFTMLIEIYLDIGDLAKVTNVLYICITELTYVLKLVNWMANKHKMLEIESRLQHELMARCLPHQHKIVNDYMKLSYILGMIYRGLIIMFLICMAVFPIISQDEDHPIPLIGWYPIDIKKYRYQITAFELLAIFVSAAINGTIDLMTFRLSSIGACELRILADNLKSFDGESQEKQLTERRMKENVIHLALIIDYFALIENIFCKGVLMQFIASVLVICFGGFQLLMVDVHSAQLPILLVYIVLVVTQILLYCVFGQFILDASQDVFEACYNSNWYKCQVNIQKMFLMIMIRLKRPASLTAWKFFVLSISTFTMVMRTSYSYLAVLMRIYKE